MIKVENLTKVYQTKDKIPFLALDNINLVLPDKGMVFLCGPSGSGKTTLLNVLAGFDDVSEGQIIVDGNNIYKMPEDLCDEYRSSLIGFIFQSFYLINNLTVKENIEIPLIINENDSSDLIAKSLDQVGLKGYEDRYPKELSGGQNQRVAIARCLVKNPKYIFADEPTGNLDNTTSIQIFELLKRLSKDRLILVVSHNEQLAYKYGDRIIEIDNGKIVKDIQKGENSTLTDSNYIYIPFDKKLTKEELQIINDKMKSGLYTLSQEHFLFNDTTTKYEENKIELKCVNRNSYKKIKNLSGTFNKNNKLPLVLYSVIIFLLLTALTIVQMFFNFDSSKIEVSGINQDIDFVLYKEAIHRDRLMPIVEQDIAEIYDKGYTGNVYKLYSYSMPTNDDGAMGIKQFLMTNRHVDYNLAVTPLIVTGKGVLECDVNYLARIYGVDGKLDIINGTLVDNGQCELIITDYFADCIKYYYGISFQDILDAEYISWGQSRYRVKAIINTKYTVRYEELLTKYQQITKISDETIKKQEMEELQNTEMFINFYNELNTYLSVAYFIDGDFIQRLKSDMVISCNCRSIQPAFYYEGKKLYYSDMYEYSYHIDLSLKPGEAIMGIEAYQHIFNKNEIDSALPIDITFTETLLVNETENADYQQDFKIVDILEDRGPIIFISAEDYYRLYELVVFNYGLYFDNNNSIKTIFINDKKMGYFTNDEVFTAIKDINDVIFTFSDIFKLITCFIYLIIVLMLLNFVYRNIKNKILEIGILRSLGTRIKDIAVIILLQALFVFIIAFSLSIITLYCLEDFINALLLNSFTEHINIDVNLDVTLIKINFMTLLMNGAIILVLIILSSYLYIWLLRRVKPVNIIKKD